MKYIQLDHEEQQILEDFEKGEFIDVANRKEEMKRFKEYARNTLNKTKNINIRLSIKDIQHLKRKAAETGLPYQTLIAVILHQFTKKNLQVTL